MISHIEPALAYWKKGDDFQECLNHTEGDVVLALKKHAEWLRNDARTLERIALALDGKKLEGSGGTHMIYISGCPDDIAGDLFKENLIHEPEKDLDEDVEEDLIEEDEDDEDIDLDEECRDL